MKKILAVAISLCLVLSMPVSAFAVFTPVTNSPTAKTAKFTVTGDPSVTNGFVVKIKNVTGDVEVSSIGWTATTGTTSWKAANQYLEVTGFATYANWGIQIYTDNTGVHTSPLLPNPSPLYDGLGYPAGLVNTKNTKTTIPMCFRVAVKSSVRDGRFAAGSVDLQMQEKYIALTEDTVILRTASDYVSDNAYFAPWFWMMDRKDLDREQTGAETNTEYTSFVDSGRYQIAPLDYQPIPERNAYYCVYLGAKFTAVTPGVEYKTNMLVVEMYHM